MVHLDKKWFYTTSRRRKLKYLPLGPHEEEGTVTLRRSKIFSRRFPCKVMFMGAVAPPNPEHDFDGRIFLQRVAVEKEYARQTYTQRFSQSGEINEFLKKKRGGWREQVFSVVSNDAKIGDLKDIIANIYAIDDFEKDKNH